MSGTISLGDTLGLAPRGRVAAPAPMRWPNKNPGDKITLSLDLNDALAAGDTISAVAAPVINPASTGDLTAATPQIASNVVNITFSAGNPGTDYGVTLSIQTAAGQTFQPTLGLYVQAPAYPVVPPLATPPPEPVIPLWNTDPYEDFFAEGLG